MIVPDSFGTVVLRRVIVGYNIPKLAYELRLYFANRLPLHRVAQLMEAAARISAEVGGSEPTLEQNRAGLCFNMFVPFTPELLADVNRARQARGIPPIKRP